MARQCNEAVAEVLFPGALTSLQDLGRHGYQALGIAESGAMDAFSLVVANRLLGNPDDSCALEATLVGPKLRVLRSTRFALSGADLSAALDDEPLAPWQSFRAEPGQVLSFGRRRSGVRAYLAVWGGFDVPLVLGSRSTYIYAGLGGFEGRPLRKGDLLPAGKAAGSGAEARKLPQDLIPRLKPPWSMRVIPGPHQDRFTAEGLHNFFNRAYLVTSQSNRMGYRLSGPPIAHQESPIVVSEATPLGAVQVPGQGVPVILLRERGTTGGYTKIGTIITPDLDLLAQASDREEVRFQGVEVALAHRLDKRRWQELAKWRPAIPPP